MTEAEPGDRVFAESPSYDRVNLLFRRRGLNAVGIPLKIDGVDMNVFEDELKKGAPKFFYTVDDFQNPMGVTVSLEKRKKIVELAQKYDFMILEDVPYRELRYSGEDIPTMYSMDPDRVVKMSSFSKTLNLYRPRMEKAIEILERELPGAVFPRPEGGFFIGVTLPEGNDMAELIPAAKEAGVLITDGRGFYLNPEDGKRFLRVPFCGLKPEEMEAAFEILLPLIKK